MLIRQYTVLASILTCTCIPFQYANGSIPSTPCDVITEAQDVTNSQKIVEYSRIEWHTSYEKAVELTKQHKLPILMYFTGSDWCGWCKKLEREVLNTAEFGDEVRDRFVFLKLDYPVYTKLDAAITKQNAELKEKFDIRGFPTVVLLSSDLKRIATVNYRPGGAKAYADYLLKTLSEYEHFQKDLSNISSKNTSDLKAMYEKANELGFDDACQSIIEAGLSKEDNLFFMKEQYRQLVMEGMINLPETQALRKELLAKDPDNAQFTHLDVAVIDFEAHAENLPAVHTADEAIKPLQEYLAQFGDKDIQNRWRIEMTISQVLRSKLQSKEAMSYAKCSLEHAPFDMQMDIAKAISEIEKESELNQIANEPDLEELGQIIQ